MLRRQGPEGGEDNADADAVVDPADRRGGAGPDRRRRADARQGSVDRGAPDDVRRTSDPARTARVATLVLRPRRAPAAPPVVAPDRPVHPEAERRTPADRPAGSGEPARPGRCGIHGAARGDGPTPRRGAPFSWSSSPVRPSARSASWDSASPASSSSPVRWPRSATRSPVSGSTSASGAARRRSRKRCRTRSIS